jgi:hypothetical protein
VRNQPYKVRLRTSQLNSSRHNSKEITEEYKIIGNIVACPADLMSLALRIKMWYYRSLNYNVKNWSCSVSQSGETANVVTERNNVRHVVCSLPSTFTAKCIKSAQY